MYIAEKNFKPRTTKPEKGNKYYIRKASGGWSPCIQGNPLDKNCNVLANCVGYGVGRFNEESNQGGITYWASMNAENFFANAYKWSLETGQEPRIGAMLCWAKGKPAHAEDGAGHIAIQETKFDGKNMTISSSGYKSYIFKTQKINNSNGRWGMGSAYTFLGFIYNPNIVKLAEPVERNDEVNQLKILKPKLRIRADAGLKADILDFATKDGIYNDLETKEADGYIWHKIADHNWLAQVDGYVELLPKAEFRVGDIVTVKQPIVKYKITEIADNVASIIPITELENLKKD